MVRLCVALAAGAAGILASTLAAAAPLIIDGATPAQTQCPGALTNTGGTCTYGDTQTFDCVDIRNGGRLIVTPFVTDNRTGNLVVRATGRDPSGAFSIRVDAASGVWAKSAGYQGKLCDNGPGPNATAGGRGAARSRTRAAAADTPGAAGRAVRPVETLCDGIDGNCDGDIDESFATLGAACDDGGIGACRDAGRVACDPADPSQTLCDLSVLPDGVEPSAERCNGIDDDCNGSTDEGVVYDMVAVPSAAAPAGLADRCEASRHDASSTSAGTASTIACAAPSVVPWTSATYADATAACAARGAGYRLCTAAELLAACATTAGNAYP